VKAFFKTKNIKEGGDDGKRRKVVQQGVRVGTSKEERSREKRLIS